MTVMWSGPGRALQAHLDLFRYIDRAHDWLAANAERGVTAADLDRAPSTMRQRLRLNSSMAQILGPDGEGTVDGASLSTQPSEDPFTQGNVNRSIGLVNTEWDILNRGETHYISHHITAMSAAAAEQAGDEPLFPTDMPCPQGLMVFEYPLLVPDLHPDTGEIVPDLKMPIRAIAWGQNPAVYALRNDGTDRAHPHPGIFYALYTDDEAWRTIFLPSVEEALPEEWAEFKDEYLIAYTSRDPLWCIDTSGWSYALPWHRSASPSPVAAAASGETHQTVGQVRRFLLALWRFQWQRILVPETHRPTRHEIKRAHRAGIHLEDGYIKVLRLRRHVEAEARGEHVDEGDPLSYDHSWIVRGHPRRQHYATLGPARNPDGSFNVDSHRLIWIDPHQKGNPFVAPIIGHNVTATVR